MVALLTIYIPIQNGYHNFCGVTVSGKQTSVLRLLVDVILHIILPVDSIGTTALSIVLQQYHSTNIAYCTTTYCGLLLFLFNMGKGGGEKEERMQKER